MRKTVAKRTGAKVVVAAIAAVTTTWPATSEANPSTSRSIAPPTPHLAGTDPFGVNRYSLATRPLVLTGQVNRGSAAALGTGSVRVDAYLQPRDPGSPVPLAFALTDATGAFAITAEPPASLAPYAGPSGMVNLTLIYTDLQTGAGRLIPRQVVWHADTSTWSVVSPPGEEWVANRIPDISVGATSASAMGPERASAVQMSAEEAEPACRPYTGEQYGAVSILPQPPSFVTFSEALAEDRFAWINGQYYQNDWTISAEYDRVSTTTVHTYDSVTFDAQFSTHFPGVSLEGGLAKTISTGTGNADGTTLGFDYSVRNHGLTGRPAGEPRSAAGETALARTAVDMGRTINLKYGVDIKTYAQLIECINPIDSYINGYVTYEPAMYQIVLGNELDTQDGSGFHSRDAGYLDYTDANEDGSPIYNRACGSAFHSGDAVYSVAAGGSFRVLNDKSQMFENGQQLDYNSTLRFMDSIGGGSATGQTRDSSVKNASSVWTQWKNNTTADKYVCGYGDSPASPGGAPVIVAVGLRADGR